MAKCKTIIVSTQKGGCGKTVTSVNLGIGLALQGKKVIIIDTDPQSSLTVSLGCKKPDELPVTLATILGKIINDSNIDPKEGILHHSEGVDFIPSSIALASIEIALAPLMGRETILRQYTELLKPMYDYIILDSAPSLSLLTVNALAASDLVIIPVVPQYLVVKGLELLLKTISRIKKHINPKLEISGILFTMVDKRVNLTRDIVSLVEGVYGEKISIFSEGIPFSVRAAETSSHGKSIFEHDPKGKVASAYASLVKEVLQNA